MLVEPKGKFIFLKFITSNSLETEASPPTLKVSPFLAAGTRMAHLLKVALEAQMVKKLADLALQLPVLHRPLEELNRLTRLALTRRQAQ